MEKKEMLTALLFIPTTEASNHMSYTVNKVAQQLGYLNCELDDDATAIKYTGIIQDEHKETLVEMAKKDHFRIIFIEAEYETPYIDGDTIRIPISKQS